MENQSEILKNDKDNIVKMSFYITYSFLSQQPQSLLLRLREIKMPKSGIF